ncbi:Penicillin-binding protein activator LpoA precursor [Shewanella sp. P1-14-1]|uniref:penicillin-binding protein activator n=1 Tax=Shewanella sp. P1-14-1 TaxID=1723761 RepID=UPI0006D66B19|nr:penicillin-binding protein activator [Shewanella sp. P1-14-1]KPZ67915.1 Penicillin-binding protein activator LpoA precursor [Shewanella sp. P1-14-1]
MLKRLITTKFVFAAILSSVLFGCATQTTENKQAIDSSLATVTQTANTYLSEASNSQQPQERDRYLLLAAHAYINDSNVSAADKLLTSMKPNLQPEPTLQAEWLYLSARVAELNRSDADALAILNYPEQWQLPNWQRVTYHQYKARLFNQTKQPIDELRQLSSLSLYLPKQQAFEVNDTIWRTLQPLHEETIKSFMRDGKNPTFSGWLQLAYIAKHYAIDPSQLVRYLGQWQQSNPNHPGAAKLPSDLEKALNAQPYKPQNIAVLLPLTGRRAAVAEPIRQGILASYMAAYDDQITLHFFDTNLGVEQAYQEAVAAGAEFVIGPLLPNAVEEMQALNEQGLMTIPQLYLNQTETFTPNNDQFYFALSPAQEASDAAQRLFDDGVSLPLLLVSNDSTGKRMAASFNEKWLALTEENAEIHYYDGGDQMKVTVQEALGVKDSQARIARMKELIGNTLEADFRSRRDIDAIYMISAAKDLALLKPFLDVNFSVFADPVALYTTSRSRLSGNSTQSAQELNNLMISDIPWLMSSNAETTMVNTLWSQWNNGQKRLYIMGYDSLDLVNRLAQMRAFPGYQFNGRSGALSVDKDGVIERKLSWGKYQRGKLRPL